MKTFNVGDKVSVLDDAIDGVVVSVKNNEVTIETSDKFLMTYFVNELIKINNSNELNNFNKSEALVKMKNDETPTRKQVELQKKLEKVERGVPEFDLHIEKLVPSKTVYPILTSSQFNWKQPKDTSNFPSKIVFQKSFLFMVLVKVF